MITTNFLSSLYIVPPFLPQLAKAEKLKPMELELRKLEDLAESIVQDFAYMRAREEEMRDTNGEFAIPFPPAPGDHSIPPLTQSPPTPEYYTSAFSPCAVCCAWLPGRCST